jgi:hypothetical protein
MGVKATPVSGWLSTTAATDIKKIKWGNKALVFRVGNSGAFETAAEAHFTGTMVCRVTRGADHAKPAFRMFVDTSAGNERRARHGTVVAGSGELHAGNFFGFCFERE